ncbi:MAG TPA: 2TM domain-containing protein [Segetibacter sp.]
MINTNDDSFLIIARKKADFRRNIYYYIAFIVFVWIVWWFTTGHITGFTGYPWPVWIMLGWGVALVKQYFQAFQRGKKL